ncbi:uncharacterized protein LOC119735565 isoform X2 [Patiria miniata]|uniref:Fido domain-containing protein n=1 Tax=Patiria miniata TaxID=46514 RepID=A0A914ANC2_PATMI|nr:uncharacterized protein LOC119735565 isoform X1 [Patiria miniata]XP_038065247.1 uncharacterized protein LOC119735565 isoform X2 [Patiria miniata]
MASGVGRKRRRHRSTVGDLLNFEPEENPLWRREEPTVPPVGDMVKDIVGYQKGWNSVKEKCDASAVQRQFLERFLFHCNREEDHGCGTFEETRECLAFGNKVDYATLSPQQKETVDLKEAYEYLLDIKDGETDLKCHGMIAESMLREVNKILLKSATTKSGRTKAGHYSDKRRFTTFEGEFYEYPNPADMHNAVNNILDRFNSLLEEARNDTPIETHSQETQIDEQEDEVKLLCLYKACSWLVFEILDLHPFGDGNGRLCRLLCSYVLSTCTPFPTPIYNIWSTSCKMDYQKALVQARKSDTRHPKALATMIIECSWHGWKEFHYKIKGETQAGKQVVLENEMLHLHPFGDGNRRLCWQLCSYMLSTCNSFPMPIYNIVSKPCKNDYTKALVQTRKSGTFHPRALVTMIIECGCHSWKEFLNNLRAAQVGKQGKGHCTLERKSRAHRLSSQYQKMELSKLSSNTYEHWRRIIQCFLLGMAL